ncbi:MAG: FAD-dependent oxidoreductase, partial [Vicinamibacterales bacterium]|nr:FAD-dependent oxidoreductase [Vicinamibacterales bacterium]
LGWADRLSVVRIGPAIGSAQRHGRGKTTSRAASPDETVENWLIRNGQTARLREMLWEPLALAAMNQPANEAGAAAFVRVLADAFGSHAGDSAIALPRVPLAQLWADPSRRFVEARGGTVVTNALARVTVDGGRISGIVTRGGERLQAGAVISTVPWHAVATLFERVPAPLQDLVTNARRMRSYPIVTVNLWFDRPVLDVPFVGLPGREMQWVFDKRAVFDGAATHLSLVSSGASRLVPMTNEQVVAVAMHELQAVVPDVTRATLRHAGVVRERHSTFSVAPGEPPRPACPTALPGFYLAGDWTDTALPGTIESAAMSGHTAARELEARG